MKRILLMLTLLPFFGSVKAQSNFTINGKVADSKLAVNNLIYLKFKQNGKETKDSAKIIKGVYQFKGSVFYPVEAVLELKVADSIEQYHKQTRFLKEYSHKFYLDKGALTANSTAMVNKTVVKGSAADDDRQLLDAKLKPFYDASNKLYEDEGRKVYESKDSAATAIYTRKSYAINDQIDSVKKNFMFSHPHSGMMMDMLKEYTRTILEPSEIVPLFDKIQPELKASVEGQAYIKRIEQARLTALGANAPDFTLKDRNGKEISLSSLKGKLILLDFWGSWCGPCRATHPHLKKLYAEYKSRGFEIFGVSNEMGKPEENYKKWTTAMDEDKMEWINVLNDKNKGEKSDGVLGKYSVNAFPTKVLIDENGKILKRFVGSGLKSQELLDEILKQKLSGK